MLDFLARMPVAAPSTWRSALASLVWDGKPHMADHHESGYWRPTWSNDTSLRPFESRYQIWDRNAWIGETWQRVPKQPTLLHWNAFQCMNIDHGINSNLFSTHDIIPSFSIHLAIFSTSEDMESWKSTLFSLCHKNLRCLGTSMQSFAVTTSQHTDLRPPGGTSTTCWQGRPSRQHSPAPKAPLSSY